MKRSRTTHYGFYQSIYLLFLFALFAYVDARLNDDLQFNINWAGPLLEPSKDLPTLDEGETMVMKTTGKETYHCILPRVITDKADSTDETAGTHPLKLLSPLTNQASKCSFRLEPYWSYEICHGAHVRQFHEDRDAMQEVKLQEFYLGKLNQEEKQDLALKTDGPIGKIQTMKFDGRDTPFYAISMGNGTKCDLNGQPRQVKVVYICHLSSNNEVMSVKEVTSCEYEVIVLTPLLCANPAFRLKENPVYDIKCHPIDGAPSLPQGLLEHDRETFLHNAGLSNKQVQHAMNNRRPGTTIQVDLTEGSLEVKVRPNGHIQPHVDPTASEVKNEADSSYVLEVDKKPAIHDNELTRQFLAGEYCLKGGSGWWHYEFCYGRYVSQFHQEPGKKTTITLGHWDEQLHLAWAKTRQKVKTDTTLLQMYSNGDYCELTGKKRVAQVKLKCQKDHQGQPMSIYLEEPTPCSYVVGVESPILCPVIAQADENGIISK